MGFSRPAALLALVLMVIPAGAHASAVSEHGSLFEYEAAPGEANQLTINVQNREIAVEDGDDRSRDTIPVSAAPPCRNDETPASLIDAFCPTDGLTHATIDLGDGSDRATVEPRIPATILGGSGNDSIESVDGAPDVIDCGGGGDSVVADTVDTVEPGCEGVGRQVPSPPLPAAPADPAAPNGATGVVSLADGTLRFRPADGVAHDVLLWRDDIDIGVADGQVPRVAVAGLAPCLQRPADAREVHCPLAATQPRGGAGATRMDVQLGDGDDRLHIDPDYLPPAQVDGGPGDDELYAGISAVRFDGGAGDDILVGGRTTDVLLGGPGNDVIDARHGAIDRLDCGAGRDRVLADPLDSIDADCEIVNGRPRRGLPGFPHAPTAIGTRTLERSGLRLVGHCSRSCLVSARLTLAATRAARGDAGALVGDGGARGIGRGRVDLRLALTPRGAARLRRLGKPPLTLTIVARRSGRAPTSLRETLWLQ